MLHRKFRKDRQPKSAPLACSVLGECLSITLMFTGLSIYFSITILEIQNSGNFELESTTPYVVTPLDACLIVLQN